MAEPGWQGRELLAGSTLLNEVNQNHLLLRYSNFDRLDIATTGVVFLFDSSDGPSEISCVGNSDNHAMSKNEGSSDPSVLEFVPLNENIAGI